MVFAILALCCAAMGRAQYVDASAVGAKQIAAWPSAMATINDGWRFSSGDNPAWAEPDYNDSGWTVVSLSSAKPLAPAGLRWYRIHLRLPAGRPPAALLLTIGENASQVFVNGRPANAAKVLSTFRYHYPNPQLVPLPDGVTDVVIAVRCGEARYEHEVIAGDAFRSAAIGSLYVVEQAAEVAGSRVVLAYISSITIDLALCIGGLATLGLFWAQRQRREYLWLGAYLVTLGLADILWCLSQKWLPFSVNALGGDPLDWLYPLLQIELTFVFVGERLGRSWRIYQGVLAAGFLAGFFFNWFGWFKSAYGIAESLVPLPAAIGLPVLLIIWLRRGNREAGWLILPSIFPIIGGSLFEIFYVVRLEFNSHRLDFLNRILSFKVGLVVYRLVALGDLLFLVAVTVVLFLRHTRLTQVQERSAAELNAAREMQRRLVPAELPQARGCMLAASYRPAAEVGGDFYQVLPQPDGSTLVVLGDVSGKGLKAAMAGTFALGALRSIASRSPNAASLLEALNADIVGAGQEGFITMICARVAEDGQVAIANAGHLVPYRNGEEVQLESGLPLGITADAEYVESTIQLAPGDRLTFLSDGVVEAQNHQGELFGFDRTRDLSTHSAEDIARAAHSHGQSDDITVLTLTLTPAEVLHA